MPHALRAEFGRRIRQRALANFTIARGERLRAIPPSRSGGSREQNRIAICQPSSVEEPTMARVSPRLGFVIGSMERGGTETHLSELLPTLQARNYRVSLLILGPLGPLGEELARAGVVVYSSPIKLSSLPKPIRRIVRAIVMVPRILCFGIRNYNGIISVYLPETAILCGLLLWPLRRRLLICQRSLLTYRTQYPAFVGELEKFAFRHCALLLANSRMVATELMNDGVPPGKIRLVYNGLSAARLEAKGSDRQTTRKLLQVSSDTTVLMVVANLHRYKGHADLIDALGLFSKMGWSLPKWKLFCVGRDVSLKKCEDVNDRSKTTLPRLQERARQLGIADQVMFLGERTDVADLLRAADVSVLPSHEEGFSNALIESMAAGLAVVATDVGGNSEALEGNCGILVPPRAPEKLAVALAELIAKATLRAELGQRARERALANYGIDQCADDYVSVYEETLGHLASRMRRRVPGRTSLTTIPYRRLTAPLSTAGSEFEK